MYAIHDSQVSRRKQIAQQLDTWGVTCGLLTAVGIFVYQVYHWAMTLDWPPIPVRWVFDFFGISLHAVYGPTDWLARIARWLLELPLSLAALAFSVLVSNLATRLLDPDSHSDRP